MDNLAPASPQPLKSLTRNQKRPTRVRSKNRVPFLDRDLLELDGFVICRVVDQHVESAQFPDRSFDRRYHALLVRDITAESESANAETAEVGDRVLRLACGMQESDGHICACLRHGQCGCRPSLHAPPGLNTLLAGSGLTP